MPLSRVGSDLVTAILPLKSFSAGKGRLGPHLDDRRREALARAVAGHTLAALRVTGVPVIVVTGSPDVARWAVAHGASVVADPGAGLDGAARAGAAAATTPRWAVVHGDLPLVTPDDFVATFTAPAPAAIAPSRDGGTSVIVGRGAFAFAYGPGSFTRHLARLPDAAVVVRPGLAHDLDEPADLDLARRHRRGGWLRALTSGGAIPPARTVTDPTGAGSPPAAAVR